MSSAAPPAGGPPDGSRQEREALIEALIAVIGAAGFQRSTVEAVVVHAGLDRDAFERHFGDLEAGFVAAWERVNECFMATIVRAFTREPTWRDGVRAAARAAARLAERHPQLARILFVDPLEAGGEARARCMESARVLARALELRRNESGDAPGDELGDESSGDAAIAEALVGGIYTAVGICIRRRGPMALPGLVPELASTVVAAYLGAEAGLEELELSRSALGDREDG